MNMVRKLFWFWGRSNIQGTKYLKNDDGSAAAISQHPTDDDSGSPNRILAKNPVTQN